MDPMRLSQWHVRGRQHVCTLTFGRCPPSPSPPPPPPYDAVCSIYDEHGPGAIFTGAGTKGHLLGCEIWGNEEAGVLVNEGANPLISSCK